MPCVMREMRAARYEARHPVAMGDESEDERSRGPMQNARNRPPRCCRITDRHDFCYTEMIQIMIASKPRRIASAPARRASPLTKDSGERRSFAVGLAPA